MNKLELTWIGKNDRPKLEPRILIEDPARSHHASFRKGAKDLFDNRLIFGDNLLALKALQQEFAGKLKCIYVDPPYNTGSAFTHYDDGVEHSLWLTMMRDRLEVLRVLLRLDGSIWVNIDDNEGHYLKVLMDEVFGRANFVANVIWQKKYAVSNDHKSIAPMHDHILVYRRSEQWRRNLFERTEAKDRQYRFEDEYGVFRISDYTCGKTSEERPNLYYPITQPNTGEKIWPNKTRVWAYSPEEHQRNEQEALVYWGKDGKGKIPAFKRYRHRLRHQGIVPHTIWTHEFAGHTDGARKEVRAVLGTESLADDFITPKPELLVSRILTVASGEGDWVLDSFAGSGTTGAVAHKLGRRWIMVELGEHCHTHIIPRMKKVINGQDPGGISEAVGWKGGGGFRYYRLAPSLLEKDQYGQWIINKKYNPAMHAEAICKLDGFTYAPSVTVYWQHGKSTESDFIYVTTQSLGRDQLQKLSDEVGPKRSLLVICSAFRVKRLEDFPNLTVRKIPKAVLEKCEWGRDDYSLEIKNLPLRTDPEPAPPTERSSKPGFNDESRVPPHQPSLFDSPAGKESRR